MHDGDGNCDPHLSTILARSRGASLLGSFQEGQHPDGHLFRYLCDRLGLLELVDFSGAEITSGFRRRSAEPIAIGPRPSAMENEYQIPATSVFLRLPGRGVLHIASEI